MSDSDKQALLNGTATIQTKVEVHNENLLDIYNVNKKILLMLDGLVILGILVVLVILGILVKLGNLDFLVILDTNLHLNLYFYS